MYQEKNVVRQNASRGRTPVSTPAMKREAAKILTNNKETVIGNGETDKICSRMSEAYTGETKHPCMFLMRIYHTSFSHNIGLSEKE